MICRRSRDSVSERSTRRANAVPTQSMHLEVNDVCQGSHFANGLRLQEVGGIHVAMHTL